MPHSRKSKPLTVEDLNLLESGRLETGQGPSSLEADHLLDLAVLFRNALREIQVCGNPEAKQIASQALNRGKKGTPL